jgi:hypothetical protein
MVDDDNLIIESLVQNQEYAPVTQEEGSQAIKYINKGKSADYHGLTIEHILFSRQARNFFPEFNIRLYDKNSESDFFFSSTKIRIFFSGKF